MSNDRAGETRKGIVDSVVGKAKEFAGAVTGKDELAEEGQLQQAGAQARKEANSDTALASAQSQQAAQELRHRTDAAMEQKRDAYEQAGQREEAVLQAAEARQADVEAQAAAQESAGRRAAEHRADAVEEQTQIEAAQLAAYAVATELTANQEQARLKNEAAAADLAAARLRTDTNSQ